MSNNNFGLQTSGLETANGWPLLLDKGLLIAVWYRSEAVMSLLFAD